MRCTGISVPSVAELAWAGHSVLTGFGLDLTSKCCHFLDDASSQLSHVAALPASGQPNNYSWHHKSAYTHLHFCGLEHCGASPTDI